MPHPESDTSTAGDPLGVPASSVRWQMHFDMRSSKSGPETPDLYRAALEMAEWGDRRGMHQVLLSEHHGDEDGFLPSPMVMAGALAAVTRHCTIALKALVLTLWDPASAAEDCVVVDQLSNGRLEITAVPGYVPADFAMYGIDIRERVKLFEAKVEAFAAALTGEITEYEGRRFRITPRSVQRPRPPVLIGGSSATAARRAARLGDGFFPQDPDVALLDAYRDECVALGRSPGRIVGCLQPMAIHVTDDVEAAWQEIGPYLLDELNSYGRMTADDPGNPYQGLGSIREARSAGVYAIVTPDECVDLARTLPAHTALTFKPLVSGMDPAKSWGSLELFVDKVLPRLEEEGLIAPAPSTQIST